MASKFDRALRRYRNNRMSPHERQEFERWLDSLAAAHEEDKQLWPEARQTALLQNIKNKMHQPKPDKTRTISPARVWLKAAAGIALVAVAAWLIVPVWVSPVKNITTLSPNDVRKSILSDGTIVWLQADSRLAYNLSADGLTREATLTGDALFEVAKDPARPFVIQCGNVQVKVTGTSFSLRATADTVMLTVLTGKVKVFAPGNTTGVDVLPNEKLLYVTQQTIAKTPALQHDLPVYISATEYNMRFTDITLNEVFARLEKKFDVTIRPAHSAIGTCRITADFTDMSLAATLDMIAQVHGITYTRQGTVLTITGEGCAL